QLELAKVDAGVQIATLDALVAAFRGSPTATQTPTIAPYNPNMPTVANPTSTITQTVAAAPTNPGTTYIPPAYTPGTGSGQLVPTPSYIPVGAWPNAADVYANQQTQITWENNTLAAQTAANHAQCLANASLSKGYGNYSSLVAACG